MFDDLQEQRYEKAFFSPMITTVRKILQIFISSTMLSPLSHCKSSLTSGCSRIFFVAFSNGTKFLFYSIQTNNIAFKCFKFHLRLKFVSISERSQANSFQNCFHSNEMFELRSHSPFLISIHHWSSAEFSHIDGCLKTLEFSS